MWKNQGIGSSTKGVADASIGRATSFTQSRFTPVEGASNEWESESSATEIITRVCVRDFIVILRSLFERVTSRTTIAGNGRG